MAKQFTRDDVPKVEDLWFNFIKKTRDLGLDFCDKSVIIELKLKDTPDHEITNRLQCSFVDSNRETTMKVSHTLKINQKRT